MHRRTDLSGLRTGIIGAHQSVAVEGSMILFERSLSISALTSALRWMGTWYGGLLEVEALFSSLIVNGVTLEQRN